MLLARLLGLQTATRAERSATLWIAVMYFAALASMFVLRPSEEKLCFPAVRPRPRAPPAARPSIAALAHARARARDCLRSSRFLSRKFLAFAT